MSGLIGGSIGFGLSIILRLELALPGFILCSSLQYNPNITFHGIFMISSMIMPILIGGFGNILLPLMLCSSDMIFPRLNALSLWLVFNSLIIMFLSIKYIILSIILICRPSINNNTLIISSYPFIFKDLYSSFITITILISLFLYWEPDILGNSDNSIIANPLITPNNILPEWYYLLFHSCPRSFPNKTIGVILVLNIIIMIIILIID